MLISMSIVKINATLRKNSGIGMHLFLLSILKFLYRTLIDFYSRILISLIPTLFIRDPGFFRWIRYFKKESPLAYDHFILACKPKFQPWSDGQTLTDIAEG